MSVPYETSQIISHPHGFFGRQGGVSASLYKSLNCGYGSQDNPDNVKQNRALVVQALSAGAGISLRTVHQCHSDKCVVIKKDTVWSASERPQVDAMVTKVPGVLLGVLTADCGPVLFSGTDKSGAPVVAAAHAGWRGALGGVLENTLSLIQAEGAERPSIKAIIGPCIRQNSYEVGHEFYETFLHADDSYKAFFTAGRQPQKYQFNLPDFIHARLKAYGVETIDMIADDTYARADKYFSHRYNTHQNIDDYGRQLSVIMI